VKDLTDVCERDDKSQSRTDTSATSAMNASLKSLDRRLRAGPSTKINDPAPLGRGTSGGGEGRARSPSRVIESYGRGDFSDVRLKRGMPFR